MRNFRKNNGITLIALVVTIVVLLILAGVTINAILGDNGIIAQARRAADAAKEAAENDERNINELANELNSILNGDGTVEEEMTKEEKISMLGGYVDFGLDLNGNEKEDDWRIFYIGGINEDDPEETKGRIYIIAADYIPNTNKAMQEVLNKKDKDNKNVIEKYTGTGYHTYYWSSAGKIPTFDYNDGFTQEEGLKAKEQTIFPELFMGTGYYCSNHTGNNNAKAVGVLQNTDNWKPFIEGEKKAGKADKADYVIGGPTLEMWVKSWNAMYGDSSPLFFRGDEKGTGYYVGGTANPESYYVYVDADDKTLYFPHTTYQNLKLDNVGENDDNCYGYWLASPSANNSSTLMYVGCSGNVGRNGYSNGDYGLRALVSLKSGVQLEDSGSTVGEEKLYNIK